MSMVNIKEKHKRRWIWVIWIVAAAVATAVSSGLYYFAIKPKSLLIAEKNLEIKELQDQLRSCESWKENAERWREARIQSPKDSPAKELDVMRKKKDDLLSALASCKDRSLELEEEVARVRKEYEERITEISKLQEKKHMLSMQREINLKKIRVLNSYLAHREVADASRVRKEVQALQEENTGLQNQIEQINNLILDLQRHM